MNPRKIIMIGGSESLKGVLRSAVPKTFQIRYLNVNQELIAGSDIAWIFLVENPTQPVIEQIRHIKKKRRKTPLVIISDDLDKEKIIEVFRLGIKDILNTPVRAEDVQRVFQNHYANHKIWWKRWVPAFLCKPKK